MNCHCAPRRRAPWLGVAALAMAAPVAAQVAPNSGTLLQELRPVPAIEPRGEGPVLEIKPPPRKAMTAPGGLQVRIARLRITGSTVFTEAQLLPLVQQAQGKSMGLDGLEELAETITRHYRAAGYTVARAYVPAQDVQDGDVELAVIEGRYSAITVLGADEAVRARLPLAALRVGDVVADRPLEQTLLLLNQLPGMSVKATLQPGAGIGTTELVIDLLQGPSWSGTLEADNSGSRATGRERAGGSLAIGNLAGTGDQLTLRALSSGKGLAYGRAAWQAPVGGLGATAGIAASHLKYELGGDFAALDASGTADTVSLFGAVPLLRSRGANLGMQANLDEKRLKDDVGSAAATSRKRATILTLSLSGDASDGLAGGGVTSVQAGWSLGRLRLEGAALAADAASARTDGSYGKAALGLQRLQTIDRHTDLYLSLNAQWASKNLDSSEKLALGGLGAVRAYPGGETASDRARIATVEVRRMLGAQWQAVGFFDIAHGTINQQRWAAATGPVSRTLRGAGLGVNWAGESGWAVRMAYARRLGSERATSDPDHGGRLWLQASKTF